MDQLILPNGATYHGEVEIKRSRFLAEVCRVHTAEEARERIAARRALFPDARHHCTGFVVSVRSSSPVLHSNDDGEPSGTAGRPILEALASMRLTDSVAIVSRYFGGTLLGTGGLVRAYSATVKETLEGAPLLSREIVPVWSVLLAHADAGRYLAELGRAGFTATPQYLNEGVTVTVPTSRAEHLSALLAQLSGGTIQPHLAGETAHERPWGAVKNGLAVESIP